MNGKRASLEIIAPSVKEAIAQGLAELGLSEDQVEIEVLDEGTKGFLGLGFRQARVRLTLKEGDINTHGGAEVESSEEALETPQGTRAPSFYEDLEEEQVEQSDGSSAHSSGRPSTQVIPSDRALSVAEDAVRELLRKMRVRARVQARFGEPDDEHSQPPLCVDVHGEDLSILIGRRAETLNALQLISSLIINKELGYSVPLVLDVEGYRQRRYQQLRQLARRMADQAVKTGKTQVLEPMPANERRIIHIELRKNPDVKTESVGQEPRRKVTIIPITPTRSS